MCAHGERRAGTDQASARVAAHAAPPPQCAGGCSVLRLQSACAAHVQATRVGETQLRGHCRWCGHGVGSGVCDVDALGARGEGAMGAPRGRVPMWDYILTRVKSKNCLCSPG